MKHKKLILTILMTLCMTIVAGFGVYATIASSLSISGTLNFVALTKEVYVNEIKISNYVDENYVSQTKIIDGWNGKYLKESASVSLGSGLNVVQGETLEIAITMTNLTSSYLRANLTYSDLGDMSVRTTGLIMPINSGKTVESGQAKTMKIYISSSSDEGYDLSQYSLNISFTSLGTSLLQDSGSYYYVEMGTVPNTSGTGAEYLKWKLVSNDLSTRYTYSSTKPTGKSFFVLTTKLSHVKGSDGVQINKVCASNDWIEITDEGNGTSKYHQLNGWTNILADDYATSTMRAYITGEKVYKGGTATDSSSVSSPSSATDYSDVYTDFCIDKDNDIVYQNIIGRTLEDLYDGCVNYGYDGLGFPTFNEGAKQIESNTVDKLWIPSYTENKNILGGGSWESNDLIYEYCWMRDNYGDGTYIFSYYEDGSDTDDWLGARLTVRPAFYLSC